MKLNKIREISLREVNFDKERERFKAMTPFKAASIICGSLALTFTVGALGYRVYESEQKKETIRSSYAALDADKTTRDIDLQPMP